MMGEAVKVRHQDATRRELAFAQLELDRVLEQINVLKGNREEPPTSLKRQKSALEAEISMLLTEMEEA